MIVRHQSVVGVHMDVDVDVDVDVNVDVDADADACADARVDADADAGAHANHAESAGEFAYRDGQDRLLDRLTLAGARCRPPGSCLP